MESIKAGLTADCEAGRFSGVVAVKEQGRVVFLHTCGFANAERDTPLTSEARFKLFSLSKPFTGATVLRLLEEGRMELDHSIRRYVPEAPPIWEPVSIRHLLHHQSGIPDHTGVLLKAYMEHGERDHQAAMRRVLSSLTPEEALPAAPAGQEWKYSNFGYELLALAAAEAADQPFHEVIRQFILEPAAMTGASVELPQAGPEMISEPSPGLVPGFVGSAEEWEPTQSYSFVQQGAGALHAGYGDLFAFDAALERGEIISPDMQRRNVTESVKASEVARYGYGWLIREIEGCTYWQHSGGTNGYATDFARVPEKRIAVAVLSNLGFAESSRIRRDILEVLIDEDECAGKAQAVPPSAASRRGSMPADLKAEDQRESTSQS